MQEFRLPGLALRLGLAGAGALVALTTGLAALTFLRVLGLTFLGRSAEHDRQRDTGLFGKAGVLGLGLGCLGLAAVTPWEIRYIARGLSPLVPRSVTLQALKSPWVLQPVFHDFSILSPSWLWVVMPIAFTPCLAGAIVLVGRPLPARPSGPRLALGDLGSQRVLRRTPRSGSPIRSATCLATCSAHVASRKS